MLMHVIPLCAVLCVGDVPPNGFLHVHATSSQTQIDLVENLRGRALSDKVQSRRAYDLSLEYSRRGNLRRAFDLLNAAIRSDPDNALAYAARSNVRSMLGDNLGGMGDADYAIGLDPKLAVAYYHRGLIYARLGMWASAADDYTATAFLDPSLDDGLLFDNLGLALMAQGKYTEAIAGFSRAIGRGSRPANSYFNRSLAYERSGQLDAAISDMNAAIQSDSGCAEAHHRRAVLFLQKGFDGQALLDLNKALELDPEDLIARADRALLLEQLGRAAAAQTDFNHLAKIGVDPGKLDRATHAARTR